MVVNSGVHSSLHANCHRQIVFAKFDLKVYYPPPYKREVWHYQEADAILIRWAIHGFNWKRALSNLNVDEQATVFNRTKCFDFNHSLGCVYPTLYIIRLLCRVYHFSLLICYPSSSHTKHYEKLYSS